MAASRNWRATISSSAPLPTSAGTPAPVPPEPVPDRAPRAAHAHVGLARRTGLTRWQSARTIRVTLPGVAGVPVSPGRAAARDRAARRGFRRLLALLRKPLLLRQQDAVKAPERGLELPFEFLGTTPAG
jgi:hypothetical protein